MLDGHSGPFLLWGEPPLDLSISDFPTLSLPYERQLPTFVVSVLALHALNIAGASLSVLMLHVFSAASASFAVHAYAACT